jgi:nucleoprotein TPR
VRELRSTETSTKVDLQPMFYVWILIGFQFKLDTLTQQLQLAQAEVERTNAELNSKSEEFSKYRRTKHSELATIQASYDSLNQTHASTQATLKTLQSAHIAQSHRLTQALARVQDLTGQLAEQEATYASEASGLRRLVGMMEEREKQAKEIVGEIEKEWAGVGERSERRETALREEVERERKARENAEKRAMQLESVLDRMGRGELPIPIPGRSTPGTPLRTPGVSDLMTEGMMGLSPTVAMASKAQRSGKTFTEVYSDYVRLQEDYAKKSAEYDHMDRTLSAVLAQIEERVRGSVQQFFPSSHLCFRPLSFPNSVQNTNASNLKHLNLPLSLLKLSLTATPRPILLKAPPRNSRNRSARMSYFRNNWKTLAAKYSLCYEISPGETILQSHLTRTLTPFP